eukprot:TRINITY_DN23180_c0_g2_i1.p1 TRINITY_DN23180_c0_g2~~TRINITY_DN23180_c0_g2_i1.p1  ORF type:complete len:139 (-),score=12.43 TRINITY_DN23180_c0_g2_i1:12-386(-)
MPCKQMCDERSKVGKSSISDTHQVVAKVGDECHALYQRMVFLEYCFKSISEELSQSHAEHNFLCDRLEVLEAEEFALRSAIDEPVIGERPVSQRWELKFRSRFQHRRRSIRRKCSMHSKRRRQI